MFRCALSLLALSTLLACTADEGDEDDTSADEQPSAIPALGGGSNDSSTLDIEVIATEDDGLDVPRDLEFNPEVEGELWIVNRADDSVTILDAAGTDAQVSDHVRDPFRLHFMEEVSSISFGAPGTFGTCQESRNTYNGQGAPNDFMGPSLWPSDREIFGESNPEAVEYLTDQYGFHTDLGSHLDMQHESPLCMGIAWESENVYWVFDGLDGSIDRVDFNEDHGPGFDDHSDGVTDTFVMGDVARVEDVPSHMQLDAETGLLYIADTGNNRIAVLDTTSGERGDNRPKAEPRTQHYFWDDAVIETVVDGSAEGLEQPSGLALHDGVLYVTDHATGVIAAFSLEGELLDWVKLDVEALMGIEVVSPEEIWVVDAGRNEVLRIRPN